MGGKGVKEMRALVAKFSWSEWSLCSVHHNLGAASEGSLFLRLHENGFLETAGEYGVYCLDFDCKGVWSLIHPRQILKRRVSDSSHSKFLSPKQAQQIKREEMLIADV